MTKPKIRLIGDTNPGTGYNNALRGLVRALEQLGYSPANLHVIGAVMSMHYQNLDESDGDWLFPYIYGDWSGDDQINIVHLYPPMVGPYWTPLNGRVNIAYCAWETDQLPKATYQKDGATRTCIDDLNLYDQVWVPSKFLVEVFRRSGVTKPIHVVPHALQPELLARPIKPAAVYEGARRFYYTGSWNDRKNPRGLLRAYFATNWTPVDASLLLHVTPHTRDLAAVEAHAFIAKEQVKQLVEAYPGISAGFGLLTTPRPYSWVLDFHTQNDVFVTASRGEGFCLPALEALAMGSGVIGSGPWAEDLAAAIGELRVGALYIVPSQKVEITPMPECRGYELDQQWWEPSREAFTGSFLGAPIVGRPEVAQRVRDLFSPTAISRIVAERLEEANEMLQRTGW